MRPVLNESIKNRYLHYKSQPCFISFDFINDVLVKLKSSPIFSAVRILSAVNLSKLFSIYKTTYLLLAEFSVHTVNFGPSFFLSIYGPSAKCAGHKLMLKKWGSVIYSTDRKNKANKMFIIWLLLVLGTVNKCRTRYLTIIWQASRKKIFIGSRKQ